MEKSPEAFRTISEVAAWLDTPAHVLRFWESRFPEVTPVKRAGGRRYYRPADMQLLGGIKHLLHTEGHTIKSVQERIKAEGTAAVSALSEAALPGGQEAAAPMAGPGADRGVDDAPVQATVPPDEEIPPIGFFFDDSEDADPAEAQTGTFAQPSMFAEADLAPMPADPSSDPTDPDTGEAEPVGGREDGTTAAAPETPAPGLFARNHPAPAASPPVPPDPEDDARAPRPIPLAAELRALDRDTLGPDARGTLADLADRLRGLRDRGDAPV